MHNREDDTLKKIITTAFVLAFFGTPAFADDTPDGPKLDGATEIIANDVQAINAAIGNESSATQEIMDIDSGSVEGDVTIEGADIQAIDAAIGNESCSDQKIGSIGTKSAC